MLSPVLFICFICLFSPCSGQNIPLNAFFGGDIIIGGLVPVHRFSNRSTTPGPLSCGGFSLQAFLHTQVMIYAIEEINQRTPRVLPNFTIGYDIYDTCGDVSFAIRATLQLLKNQSDPMSCFLPPSYRSALPEPQTKAVIGESSSEISIAVGRITALSSVAQVSYGSTSMHLSRKFKFPTFLRTISSDEHQTIAIAQLVEQFNWKTVAIIGSDDGYGKYGSDNLRKLFEMCDLCIEFVDILPSDFSQNTRQAHSRLAELVSSIGNSTAEALILFTKSANVEVIIKEAIKHNFNRTWIASDAWSTSTVISSLPGIEEVGEVFGFISKRNEVPGFKDYVITMFNRTHNAFLKYCLEFKHCPNSSGLTDYIDQDGSYNIYLAVQVIAEGLRNLLKCDGHQCRHNGKFSALELLMEIKKVNFTVNSTRIFFDSNGDPSLGYDVVYWNMSNKQDTRIQTIGEYWPKGQIKIPQDLIKEKKNVTVTAYNCSKTCRPGHELREHRKQRQKQKQCCFYCAPCEKGDYSPGNGTTCESCTSKEYSSLQRDKCLDKTVEFLLWSDPFIIILICLNVFGMIVTMVFAVLFTIHRRTPIVKAVGGYLCFLELFSLLVCFGLTFSFIGKPSEISCKIGMPVFGIALSLCFSCILANLLQILVGFHFEMQIGSWIKKLNKPIAVVIILSSIQLGLCVAWLYFSPPHPDIKDETTTILHLCDKGSNAYFTAMLSYNGFLAVSCFLFAFKGKQLPDLYKNASLITISMTLFLIIWILFIPIYISLFGKYKQAIEMAAILISIYSILGCHLAPKCYIMVFRKEINNINAITEYIRKHYEMKNVAVIKS